MNAFIQKYFRDTVQYPSSALLAGEILPLGTYYSYVSSTFLNGLLNYVIPFSVILLDRYSSMDDLIEADDLPAYMEPAGSLNWVKPTEAMPKSKVVELYTQPGRTFHSKLDTFRDDILILGRVGNHYWFFWFDMDVSDCCVGRFITEDDESEVLRNLRDALDYPSTPIPLHFLQGWVRF